MPLDLSTNRIGDKTFFLSIRNECFNNRVGEAFYYYLIDKVDISLFISDYDVPVTQSKKNNIISTLNTVIKFLKC